MQFTFKKILILIGLVFIIIDIFLFLYYKSNSIKFITKKPLLIFKTGEIKIYKPSNNVFGEAVFLAVIKDAPKLKSGLYFLPIKLLNSNNKTINANLVLGSEEHKIFITHAENGIIKNPIESRFEKVKDIKDFFKKRDPVIIGVPYGNIEIEENKKIEGCIGSCKKFIDLLLIYSSSTKIFVEQLNNSKPFNNLFIGPSMSLVIYEK